MVVARLGTPRQFSKGRTGVLDNPASPSRGRAEVLDNESGFRGPVALRSTQDHDRTE